MKKDEIKKHLSTYKNVMEMIREANNLKAKGESEIMVNRCVAELRKDMLNAATSIKRLQRVSLMQTSLVPVGYIPVQVDMLSTPVVIFDGTNVLM